MKIYRADRRIMRHSSICSLVISSSVVFVGQNILKNGSVFATLLQCLVDVLHGIAIKTDYHVFKINDLAI